LQCGIIIIFYCLHVTASTSLHQLQLRLRDNDHPFAACHYICLGQALRRRSGLCLCLSGGLLLIVIIVCVIALDLHPQLDLGGVVLGGDGHPMSFEFEQMRSRSRWRR
jgi:hypothetical protein